MCVPPRLIARPPETPETASRVRTRLELEMVRRVVCQVIVRRGRLKSAAFTLQSALVPMPDWPRPRSVDDCCSAGVRMSPVTSLTDRSAEVRARLSSIQRSNNRCLPGPNIPFPIECAVKQPRAHRLTILRYSCKRSLPGCVSLLQDLVWLGATSGGISGFNFGLLLASLGGTMLPFLVCPVVACLVGIAIGASIARQFALSRRLDLCHWH